MPEDVLERLLALEHFGIKLGLDNIRTLVAALDYPHESFVSLHVAGTNGKGSVSAMVERAVRAAGYRTGRYTSPHLERLEERIALDGQPIAPALFRDTTTRVLATVDQLRRSGKLETIPTFFEVTTAIAFEAFRQARAEVAVVEVGLGGRFDATNVITPAVAAITSIALDHEQHLGSTIAAIAGEKAGILKPGVPAVIGAVQDAARSVIETVAAERGAPLVVADRRLLRSMTMTRGRATISVSTPSADYEGVPLALSGEHQVLNALVAIRMLEVLNERGLTIDHSHIVTGITDAVWPARLEWLQFVAGQRVLIDAAHNVAGAEALARYLDASGEAPLPLVMAVMKDKDVDGILRALTPVASEFVMTTAATARSLRAEDLAARARGLGRRVTAVPIADDAVGVALSRADHIAVAGSIFLVGPLRARLLAAGAVSLQGS